MTKEQVTSIQVDNKIFLLNGEEFYQLKLNGSQKYLEQLVSLQTNVSNPVLMFDVVSTDENNLLVILTKSDHFEVFEVPMRPSENATPIQKITTSGGFQGAEAIRQQNGEVIFITATYLSKIESMIR